MPIILPKWEGDGRYWEVLGALHKNGHFHCLTGGKYTGIMLVDLGL